MKNMILYGAGGHAYAVVELVRSLGEYTIETLYDANPKTQEVLGIPVEKGSVLHTENLPMGISIGDNTIRKKIADENAQAIFPSFVHKTVVQYPSVCIGKGSMVLPGVILDASVTIGNFAIINNHATISHNVSIGDFSHVAINAAVCGGASVGEGTLIGAGSVVLPNVSVGKWAVVGAGAIVTKNVPDHTVVYGNPAKITKNLLNEE